MYNFGNRLLLLESHLPDPVKATLGRLCIERMIFFLLSALFVVKCLASASEFRVKVGDVLEKYAEGFYFYIAYASLV